MTNSKRCSKCGAEMSQRDDLTSICPACHLELAFEAGETEPGVSGGQAESATTTAPPEKIGPYRILEVLGQGGMGIVYLAEQTEPIQRRVALKVIKTGMDTRAVIARFESERQSLALMNHPAIAHVLEAGETSEGRPYFVMELVEGEPITVYCDRKRFSLAERLQLFVLVCEGVEHAHQKGVIHRDLKPSNVLVARVDGQAVPKIIDFGVAKAVEPTLGAREMFTELGVMVGTPEYMSPEQAESSPLGVDTRTDVFSLGVLLYELLVGVLPFDPKGLRKQAFDEIRRIIREVDPPTPSSRFQTLHGENSSQNASRRRINAGALVRQLSGDLDRITMMALEKDRARRYGSPSALADDINRHLRNEPVVARSQSAAYKMRKFVRRNRLLVASLSAVLIAVVAGAVAATVFAVREAEQRRDAEQARDELAVVAKFQGEMLAGVDPQETGRRLFSHLGERVADAERGRGGDDLDVERVTEELRRVLRGVNPTDVARWLLDVSMLDPAAVTIDTSFADSPLVEARLRHELGDTYLQLGLYDKAETQLAAAVEIRRRELGERHADALFTANAMAVLYRALNRLEEAEQLHRSTLGIQRETLGADHRATLMTLSNLAMVVENLGRYEEAEQLHREGLELRRRSLGADHPDTLESMSSVAFVLMRRGRQDDAEAIFLEVLEQRRRLSEGEDLSVSRTLLSLSGIYHQQQRYEAAERARLEALAGYRRVLGEDHPSTIGVYNDLGFLYQSMGKADEAERIHSEALADYRRVVGEGDPTTLLMMMDLGVSYSDQGRREEALEMLTRTLKLAREYVGDEHPYTLGTMNALGAAHFLMGRYDLAEPVMEEALETRERVLGKTAPDTLMSLGNMAECHAALGRRDRAEALSLELIDRWEELQGDASPNTMVARKTLAGMYANWERYDEALELYEVAGSGLRAALGEDHSMTLDTLNNQAATLLMLEPSAQGDQSAVELALLVNRKTGFESPSYLDTLAVAYSRTGEFAKAVETERQALELLDEQRGPLRDELERNLIRFEAELRGTR